MDPVQLHIPAIGTLLSLVEPWHFRLYFERRNDKFASALTGHNFDYYGWRTSAKDEKRVVYDRYDRHNRKKPDVVGETLGDYRVGWDTFGVPENEDKQAEMEMNRTWREHKGMCYIDVELPAGMNLTVDRIYIRKGIDAYNSITFWAKKPPKPKKVKKGETPPPADFDFEFKNRIGGTRFWAKLPDVNKIKCLII